MSEQAEADDIDGLIETYVDECCRWVDDAPDDRGKKLMDDAKNELEAKIRSIISERDALRAAMQSHRKELR